MLFNIQQKPWLAYGTWGALAITLFMVASPAHAAPNSVVVFALRPVISQIAALSTPERAIVAKIAAEFNTDCTDGHCSLTDSLNLGEQCSVQHKALLNQTFGNAAGAVCTYQLNAGRNTYALRSLLLNKNDTSNQWRVSLQYKVSFEGTQQCFDQERTYVLSDSLPWRLRETDETMPQACATPPADF
jgi:hypothetical protein